MTKSSSCKSLDVFDFKEEDELQESSSAKYMEKFNNLTEDQPVLKYNFLQFVSVGTSEETNEVKIPPDVDAIDSDHSCDNGISSSPPGKVGNDYANKEVKSELDDFPQSETTSNGHHLHFKTVDLGYESIDPELEMKTSSSRESSPGNKVFNCAAPDSPSYDEPVGVVLDVDESLKETPPSTFPSNLLENNIFPDQCSPARGLGGGQMGDEKTAVNLYPDFLMCQDTCCTDVLISFSSSYIQITGSLTNENLETINYQWGVDEVVDVECQWYGKVETAMVKLHVISPVGASNTLNPSGIQELIFAVVDSNWPQEQESITSLNVRYKAMWNVVIDNDMEMDEDAMLGQNSIFSSKQFFPNFDQPFEEVIYPKGDSDPVSISKRDVDLLQPETFINDTIVDFYIKYLKNKIQPEEKDTFHFFNSFFFRKLADLEKDPFIGSEGRTAFLRVRKWTRKVNLFEKDYLFIPVNFNLHWSLIVICHPGEVANFKDEDVEKALKVPCILHMDSIKGTHAGLKNHIQSYLWEEWKEKQNEVSEDISAKFHNMRFIPLELPQQENSFDCGLFLLHYVELFLEEVPDNFSPFKITKFSSFLNVDWFPPTEASLKRAPILRLIYEILENHSRETFPEDNCDEEHNTKNRTGVEFLSMNSNNPSKTCRDDLLDCQTSKGIESSKQNSHYLNDLELSVKEINDTRTSSKPFDSQIQAFDQIPSFYQYKGPMEPIEEEDAETGEQFVYSPPVGRTGSPKMDELLPYASEDSTPQRSWLGGLSTEPNHEYDSDSDEDDDDSSDVGIIETIPFKNSDQRNSPPLMENLDPASVSCELPETTVSEEDMENLGKLHHSNLNEEILFSQCQENPVLGDDAGKITDDGDEQVAKRIRLSPPPENQD